MIYVLYDSVNLWQSDKIYHTLHTAKKALINAREQFFKKNIRECTICIKSYKNKKELRENEVNEYLDLADLTNY